MHLSFIKNKLLTLFAAIGVIITILPFSLEAGILGQWCSNENNLSNYRYRCGSFWQVVDCNSYYDKRYQVCQDRDYSCCNPSNKSSETPYEVAKTPGQIGGELSKLISQPQRKLIHDFFGAGLEGAESAFQNLSKGGNLPQGLTQETLETYRKIAQNAINGGIDIIGTQGARLKAIEEALKKFQ